MHHPTDRIAHTTAYVTPVVKYWPERKIAQLVHRMKDLAPTGEERRKEIVYLTTYFTHL